MKNSSIILIIGVFLALPGHTQESETSADHRIGFGVQYVQIKEAANYGYVNQGLNLSINYSYDKLMGNRLFSYTPVIAFGPNYRNGLGLNWQFKFVDLSYGFRICNKADRSLFLGGFAAINYLLQLYPEMQSGHMFWFTTMDIGPKINWFIELGDRLISINAGTSLFGFTSRPIDQTEQYYYSLKVGDIIADAHRNMEFGSFNKFNHTFLGIDYAHPTRNKLIMGYALEYFGYYDNPTYSYLTHSIILKWKLGK